MCFHRRITVYVTMSMCFFTFQKGKNPTFAQQKKITTALFFDFRLTQWVSYQPWATGLVLILTPAVFLYRF